MFRRWYLQSVALIVVWAATAPLQLQNESERPILKVTTRTDRTANPSQTDSSTGVLGKGENIMQMNIIELWPEDTAFDGSVIPPRVTAPTVFKESGWQSVKEMQKELMRRFP